MALIFFLPFLFQKGLVGRVLTHAHALSNNKSRQMIMDIYSFFFFIPPCNSSVPPHSRDVSYTSKYMFGPLPLVWNGLRPGFFFFLPFGLVDICLNVLLLTVLPRVVSVFFFFSPLLFIRRFVYNVSFYFSCPAHCIFTFIFRFPTSGSIVIWSRFQPRLYYEVAFNPFQTSLLSPPQYLSRYVPSTLPFDVSHCPRRKSVTVWFSSPPLPSTHMLHRKLYILSFTIIICWNALQSRHLQLICTRTCNTNAILYSYKKKQLATLQMAWIKKATLDSKVS